MNEGYYDGTVLHLEPRMWNGKITQIAGRVDVDGDTVNVTNYVAGQYDEANQSSIDAIVELGVEWPDGLVTLTETTKGKACRIRVTAKGKARLISSGGAAKLPKPDELKAAIAAMKRGDDEPPF